jgi:hypothetical protein
LDFRDSGRRPTDNRRRFFTSLWSSGRHATQTPDRRRHRQVRETTSVVETVVDVVKAVPLPQK